MDNMDINRLWQNWLDTITNHYADFNGRVGRPQFWYYVLVTVVLSGVVALIAFLIVKYTVGLRVPEESEREGLDITSHGESAYES